MEPFTTFIWKRIFVQIGGVIAIAAILGGFVLAYNATYNTVVNLDQLADERWARIIEDMQERYGEIPVLVSYLGPSLGSDDPAVREVMRNLSHWNAALRERDIVKLNPATTDLEASLSYLATSLKDRPEIEASIGVQDFMETLEGTEQRLLADRSSYNEMVQGYNRAISSFPASLWTYNWGFSRREYFTARIGTTKPPPVPVE
jgi:LemA protein